MFKRAMLEKMQLVGEITELAIATADEVMEQLMQFDHQRLIFLRQHCIHCDYGHCYQLWSNKSFLRGPACQV